MFIHKKSYSKKFMQMHENCPVCGQPMEIEPSFYYGTGYVSYALSVAVTVASFIAWWVIVGLSLHDNRFFWWIGFNAVLLLALQPYLMRLSRIVWLSFLCGTMSGLLLRTGHSAGAGRLIKRKRIEPVTKVTARFYLSQVLWLKEWKYENQAI